MANEIIFRRVPGQTYAITIRDIENLLNIWKVAATAAFEAFGTDARTLSDYGINAAETYGNGMFSANMPGGIAATAKLMIEVYRRAGESLADDDAFDGSFEILGDGSLTKKELTNSIYG